MKKELRTMEEKQSLDPNEVMENGLTRERNEKLDKDGETFSGVVSLICGVIAIWVILKTFSNM
jgi:hypothetical protein